MFGFVLVKEEEMILCLNRFKAKGWIQLTRTSLQEKENVFESPVDTSYPVFAISGALAVVRGYKIGNPLMAYDASEEDKGGLNALLGG